MGAGAISAAVGASSIFAIDHIGALPGGVVITAGISQSAINAGNVSNGSAIVLAGNLPTASTAAIRASGAQVGVSFLAFGS